MLRWRNQTSAFDLVYLVEYKCNLVGPGICFYKEEPIVNSPEEGAVSKTKARRTFGYKSRRVGGIWLNSYRFHKVVDEVVLSSKEEIRSFVENGCD